MSKKKSVRASSKETESPISDSEESSQEPSSRTYEMLGIVLLASALLLGPSLVSVQFSDGLLIGPFGQTAGMALNKLLGLTGYVLIVLLVSSAFSAFGRVRPKSELSSSGTRSWQQRIGMVLTIGFSSGLTHLITNPLRLADAPAAGIIGEAFGELLRSFLSTLGAWIVCLAGLALSIPLIAEFSWVRFSCEIKRWLSHGGTIIGDALTRIRARLRHGNFMFQRFGALLRHEPEIYPDGTATVDSLPIIRIDLDEHEIQKTLPEPVVTPLPDDLEIGKLEIEKKQPRAAVKKSKEPVEAISFEEALTQTAQASFVEEHQEHDDVTSQPLGPLMIVETSYRAAEAKKLDDDAPPETRTVNETDGPGFMLYHETYTPPPLSLLKDHLPENPITIDREAIYRQAERLTKSLADYKIVGRVSEVRPGPVVTMYEFIPAPGTRISKISSLSNDLAMSLHAQRVRIVAPLPGKGAIGIEVPNEQRETVSFKEIVIDDAFRKSKAHLALAIGKAIDGAPVVMDLSKMPHLLVAGSTGAGKSVSINAMICSLLCRYTPEDVRMIMVDPKFLELSGYNDIPHLMLPVVTDPQKATISLKWAVAEMERRYQLLADARVRDIRSYNAKVEQQRGEHFSTEEPDAETAHRSLEAATPSQVLVVKKEADGSEVPIQCESPTIEISSSQDDDMRSQTELPLDEPSRSTKTRRGTEKPLKKLPYIVVIIDEFADLMMVASKDVETSVARLAQKARAAGIHLILATQRPSVDVITGLIKANFPSRMAFQVASNHDSKTILGTYGAENLLGSGDMLVLDRGSEMKRIHGSYLSDEEIQDIVAWIRKQGKPIYDMNILKVPDEDVAQHGDEEPFTDELYDKAVSLVAETRQASISMVQRRLRIGYNRAARMVEQMEQEGIVGPPDGVKGREVLIQGYADLP